MYSGVPTIWAAELTSALLRRCALDMRANSTVHEALADGAVIANLPSVVNNGRQITDPYDSAADTRQQGIQCICIGNGGTTTITGPGGSVQVPAPKPHIGSDASLKSYIPFVCVPIGSDITGSDRARFCLRITLFIGGQLYAAYFGMFLPAVIGGPTLNERIVTNNGDGTTTVVDSSFTPSIDNIRLQNPIVQGSNQNVYLSADYPDAVVFTQQDCQRMQDAAALIFGDAAFAVINEVAVCTGVAKPVNQQYSTDGTQTLTPINPTGAPLELVACRVSSFLYANQSAVGSTGFTINLNTGVSDPLYGRES